jgi:UDP-2,3-diacylglucosamine hydrolase
MSPDRKKVFFASDLHLGIDTTISSKDRELLMVSWLSEIEDEACGIYLLGDIFDHWFDYREVVPKGFTLLLGKLKYLRLKGIPIYFFTGNHDMWVFDYFEKELDIPTYKKPIIREIYGKCFYLAHGFGLDNASLSERLMKKMFASPFFQWLYARIHPNTGISIMKYFSRMSRNSHSEYKNDFNPETEKMLAFAEEILDKNTNIDYFVFGHRHIPAKIKMSKDKTEFINIGDWITNFTYGVFDGKEFIIERYDIEKKRNLKYMK